MANVAHICKRPAALQAAVPAILRKSVSAAVSSEYRVALPQGVGRVARFGLATAADDVLLTFASANHFEVPH